MRGRSTILTLLILSLALPNNCPEWSILAVAARTTIATCPPEAVEDALRRLGRNLRTARLRRRLRIQDVADRLGTSRLTVADVEKGKPGTSVAAYFGALWALGLLNDADHLADPDLDDEGKTLESAHRPTHARPRRPLHGDF